MTSAWNRWVLMNLLDRLKEKLLSEIPELEAHKQGRDVLLTFQKDINQKSLTNIMKL